VAWSCENVFCKALNCELRMDLTEGDYDLPIVPVIKCFPIPPNSKKRKKLHKKCLCDARWHTNLL